VKRASIIKFSESYKKKLESAELIIVYKISDDKYEAIFLKIGAELRQYLESKKHIVVVRTVLVITNAKLLSDKK